MSEKVALVTGASRGIGYSIASCLAAEGYRVVGTATSDTGLAAIEKIGTGVSALNLNLSNKDSIDTLINDLQSAELMPAILVNNAGITSDNITLRMKDDEWERVIETNLTGVFRLTQKILKHMLKQRYGRIVNLSSVVGFTGNPGQANYAAAKAGLVGFTKSIALEFATRGITANVIAPGFIATDMTMNLSDTQKEALLTTIPMNRMGRSEDIAAGVKFLCSDSASYITGQTLHINGGMYMV